MNNEKQILSHKNKNANQFKKRRRNQKKKKICTHFTEINDNKKWYDLDLLNNIGVSYFSFTFISSSLEKLKKKKKQQFISSVAHIWLKVNVEREKKKKSQLHDELSIWRVMTVDRSKLNVRRNSLHLLYLLQLVVWHSNQNVTF